MPNRPDPSEFATWVLCATDFSPESQAAFEHALALAVACRADLTLLHAGAGHSGETEWRRFPPIRRTLERWGLLEPGSPPAAVPEKLSIRAEKVGIRGPSELGAVLGYLEDHEPDLLVLATEAREGVPRWVRPSRAEHLARHARLATLFVPKQGRGFVAAEDGRLVLHRILVPVDRSPDPSAAVDRATRIARHGSAGPVEIELLHVGEDELPPVQAPESPAWTWTRTQRRGRAVEQIVAAAHDPPADLVVMATRGHQGFLDALRGSVTEQVLRRAGCPVLAVPAR